MQRTPGRFAGDKMPRASNLGTNATQRIRLEMMQKKIGHDHYRFGPRFVIQNTSLQPNRFHWPAGGFGSEVQRHDLMRLTHTSSDQSLCQRSISCAQFQKPLTGLQKTPDL